MNRYKGYGKYKRRKKPFYSLKNFLVLFCLLLVLVLIAAQFYNNAERQYPRPDSYLVSYYCAEYGVESNLVYAIMKQESNFNEDALSHKGAVGLMQLMPATAQWAAEKVGEEYDEASLTQSSYNLKLAIWFISYLQEEFDGDDTKVMAAYNAGDGNVTNWLSQGIWDGSLGDVDSIPFEETRTYVTRVSDNLEKYREIYE